MGGVGSKGGCQSRRQMLIRKPYLWAFGLGSFLGPKLFSSYQSYWTFAPPFVLASELVPA